ncbi:MAG: substrate-binding domain-containing protein, partial [bacterium]|nr:substrate-binding domain-containing protein [bacterium]
MSRTTRHAAAPHILVTIPTANFTQRKILEGVLDYAREKGPWLFHLNTGDIAAQGLRRVSAWGVDGVIVLSANPELLARVARLNRPTVLINAPLAVRPRRRDMIVVRRDNPNLGRMAAEHLLGGGFRSFAFVGSPRPAEWSDGRRDGFTRKIAAAGFPCAVYPTPTPDACADFSREAPRLSAWLKALPKRTALYTVKDIRGQQILAAC